MGHLDFHDQWLEVLIRYIVESLEVGIVEQRNMILVKFLKKTRT